MSTSTPNRKRVLYALFSPILLVRLLLLLLGLPFYWAYRLLLRCVVELVWVARGRRILLVYSRSPVWQEHIETTWLPRLRDHAVVLDWSDRASWPETHPLAARVFRHWAPAKGFNPMAILFPAFLRTRRIAFYDAFRDWKHGNAEGLRAAEAQLLDFADALQRPDA